jgi:glycosyltransferase involved in cell wall biosynthesis
VAGAGRASDGQPSVTVITRTRNRPLFLDRALGSVLGQTHTDLELVILNDGGDPAQVDELVRAHPAPEGARVRVVHHPERVGLRAPPNAPIRESRSPFVAIHDDDDSWHPTFLERTIGLLGSTGAMGVVTTTDRVVERVDGERIELVEQTRLHPGLRHLSLYELCFDNYATTISFVYRREAYDALGGYDESLETVADWDFAIRFLTRFDIELLRSPEALAFYHYRPEAVDNALNSVYGDAHGRAENALANRYLRADLESGRPGLGFVMNALRHEYAAREALFEREGVAADSRTEYIAAGIGRIDARLAEIQFSLTAGQRLQTYLAYGLSLPRRLARRARESLD